MKLHLSFYRFFVSLGFFLFLVGMVGFVQQYIPRNLIVSAFSQQPQNILPQENTHSPVKLTMEGIGVDLPIFESHIYDGVWETTSLGVSSLGNPEEAGASGGLILYGHNWSSILGKLAQSQVGQPISVTYADGEKKDYTIQQLATVSPTDSSFIEKESSNETLILYTCVGFLDSERLMVVASAI